MNSFGLILIVFLGVIVLLAVIVVLYGLREASRSAEHRRELERNGITPQPRQRKGHL